MEQPVNKDEGEEGESPVVNFLLRESTWCSNSSINALSIVYFLLLKSTNYFLVVQQLLATRGTKSSMLKPENTAVRASRSILGLSFFYHSLPL
jgi:hypothetical protein